jgi:hypothetical protein
VDSWYPSLGFKKSVEFIKIHQNSADSMVADFLKIGIISAKIGIVNLKFG